jgi:hypothetical protein
MVDFGFEPGLEGGLDLGGRVLASHGMYGLAILIERDEVARVHLGAVFFRNE